MLFMFWRLYTVLRHFERYHEYTDSYSKKVCRTFGFYPSRMMTLKIELLENPARMTFVLLFFTIFLLAFMVRVFEIPYEKHEKTNYLENYGTAVYMTVITLTTVGYGDFFPYTSGGQAVCMFTALWGSFVVSMLVLVAASIFELKPQEDKAIRFIKQSRTASKSILLALRFYVQKKKFYIHRMEIDPDFVVNSTFLKMVKAQEHQRNYNLGSGGNRMPTLMDEIIKNDLKRQQHNRDRQNKMLVQLKQKFETQINNKKSITLGKKMNEVFIKLQESLKVFISDKEQYDKLLDENEVEMLNSNRVIKKEVIDMSDLVEKISSIILSQNQKIDQQDQEMREMKSLIQGQSREEYKMEEWKLK